MFADDVRFEGFTATDWARVLKLFQPRRPQGEARDPDRPRGLVVAVHEGPRLWKLLHSEVGRLRLDDAQRAFPCSAEALARNHHASWAVRMEAGALEAVMDGFGERARRGDDLVTQLITLLGLARDEASAGRLEIWPSRLRGVPMPSEAVVRGSLDAVCPQGKSMVVGLFEAGELDTCIALHRGPRGIDVVLGPEELRDAMGLFSGDFRRDYRHVASAVERRLGPLAFGCFGETKTIRDLEVDPTPGAWAKAAAVRDLILSPLPAPLAIPLGVDATRLAVSALRGVADRFDPLGIVGPSIDRMREVSREVYGVDMFAFHPLVLLRKLLERDR